MTWTKTQADRQRDSQVYGPEWRKARAAQLRRQPCCELRYPDICRGRATEVDHVLGAGTDKHHNFLRSVCGPCHRHRTATEQGGRRNGQSDPPPRPATIW